MTSRGGLIIVKNDDSFWYIVASRSFCIRNRISVIIAVSTCLLRVFGISTGRFIRFNLHLVCSVRFVFSPLFLLVPLRSILCCLFLIFPSKFLCLRLEFFSLLFLLDFLIHDLQPFVFPPP